MRRAIVDAESLLVNFLDEFAHMEKDFFEILGFENASLFLDYNDLEAKYIFKQLEYSHDSELQEKINRSYETLKNPLKRLEYFLLLKKFELNQEADKQFLLDFFELNEKIENIDEESEMKKYHSQFIDEMGEILKKIDVLFGEKDCDIKKINELYTRAKYIHRILENHFNYK